ncbi:hypothetical protein AB0O21_25375, partial [Streptomyces sp. NPDC091371]
MAVVLGPRTELVGRELEAAALRERLRDPSVRLVTVTGRAGVGKTRLAEEVVREIRAEFERVEVLDAEAAARREAGQGGLDRLRELAGRSQDARGRDARGRDARGEGARGEGARGDGARGEGGRNDGARGDGARNGSARDDGARNGSARDDGARNDSARDDGARNDSARDDG